MQKDDHLVILKVNTVSIYFLCEGPLLLSPHAIFVAVMDILKIRVSYGTYAIPRNMGTFLDRSTERIVAVQGRVICYKGARTDTVVMTITDRIQEN